ncbi:MAG: hypothetical protein HY319_13595 [Armatimonadetes bacterium]|nr:hypothetical protein [Armatimonadota bacterium]
MAIEAMRKAQASDEVRELIELRRKALHDEATRLEEAVNRGRQEALRQTACGMCEEGFADEVVARLTGLTPDEWKGETP